MEQMFEDITSWASSLGGEWGILIMGNIFVFISILVGGLIVKSLENKSK